MIFITFHFTITPSVPFFSAPLFYVILFKLKIYFTHDNEIKRLMIFRN